MNSKDWEKYLISLVMEISENRAVVEACTRLTGSGGILSSMQLVELLVGIEDKCGEVGLVFDWTSDSALSQNRSVYQSIATLAAHLGSLRARP